MKRFFAAIMLGVAMVVFSMTPLAQSPMQAPPYGDYPAHVHSEELFDLLTMRSGPYVRREPRVIKQGLLAPSIDDRIAFTIFLQRKNTGLIRLLPREVYDIETNHAKKKLKIRGGGAYYSFANLTHAYGYGSDIELKHDRLSVGLAGADYGMLTNIGDTPLEQITLDDFRVKYIAAYRPTRSLPEAREKYRQLSSAEGPTLDGFLYQQSLPVQENSTYLLRSIVYRKSDVLVVFRLARKDPDGSVIIAWKLLKQYPTPKLKRYN